MFFLCLLIFNFISILFPQRNHQHDFNQFALFDIFSVIDIKFNIPIDGNYSNTTSLAIYVQLVLLVVFH